jgi:hypothetical protein
MLETIKLILSLLPLVIQAVRQLEELFPESDRGAMKLDLIRRTIQNVYDISDNTLPLIEKMVNTIVDIFNKFGIFKK